MSLNAFTFRSAFTVAVFALSTACAVAADGDGDNDNDDDSDNTKGACESTADCDDGTVCVGYGDVGARCTVTCSVDAEVCSGSATCSALGTVDVDVCEDDDRRDDPDSPAEQPRVPCKSDDECSAVDAGTICVEYRGEKACTLPCDVEADCTLPSTGGVTVDFLTCGNDEAATRTACIIDEACLDNPLSCIDTDFPAEGEGEDDDDGNTAGACDDGDDCSDGYACVRFGDAAAECTKLCDSNTDCADDAGCAPIDLLDISVCEDDDRRDSSEEEPDPAEAPVVQCTDDAECAASPGTVCATYGGERQCTLPCSSESACDTPAVGGFSFDFMTCGDDEGADRDVCIPDEACFANPLSCMDF